MLYPSRTHRTHVAPKVAVEDLDEAATVPVTTDEVNVPELQQAPAVLEVAETAAEESDSDAFITLANDNQDQYKADDIASTLSDMHADEEIVRKGLTIAQESLASGGLNFDNACSLATTVRFIAGKYGIKPATVGLENFIYDDSQKLATESFISSTLDVLERIVRSIGAAADEYAGLLMESVKRLQNRGPKLMKQIDGYRDSLSHLESVSGAAVRATDHVTKLRVNGELNLDACMKLASSEMSVLAIGDRWRGLWTRKGRDSAIYSDDFQADSGEFLEPIAVRSSKSVDKAIPSRLKGATPINVYGLPGDVFVVMVKRDSGLIQTGWSDGVSPNATDEYLPAITSRDECMKVLNNAWVCANILNAKLSNFIKASDAVQAAVLELTRSKEDGQTDAATLKQLRENVSAAYAMENAIIRSVWNVAEGLTQYAYRSVLLGDNKVQL